MSKVLLDLDAAAATKTIETLLNKYLTIEDKFKNKPLDASVLDLIAANKETPQVNIGPRIAYTLNAPDMFPRALEMFTSVQQQCSKSWYQCFTFSTHTTTSSLQIVTIHVFAHAGCHRHCPGTPQPSAPQQRGSCPLAQPRLIP